MKYEKFFNIVQYLMKYGYNEAKAIELFLEYEKMLKEDMKNKISKILDDILNLITGSEQPSNVEKFEMMTKEELTTKKLNGVLYNYKIYLLDEIVDLFKKIFNTEDYCISKNFEFKFNEIVNSNNSDLCEIRYRNELLLLVFLNIKNYWKANLIIIQKN